MGRNGQNDQISVFWSKSVFRYGGITSQIFRGLAALEPPKIGGQRGGFFSFSIENEKKMEKIFCKFCKKSFKDSKTVFIHSSIKTEKVLFFYIYIYIYIYIYLYICKKLSPKWKNFQ